MFRVLICLLVFSVAGLRADEPILVDPLLIKQAEAVFQVIAKPDNPIWPGWDASDTPIMIYMPKTQEILINHPKPGPEFNAYSGPLTFGKSPIFVHTGKTQIEWDGQNTSRDIFGINTLIVADTLSNRKQDIASLLENSDPVADKISELSYASLRADPYDQMALIAHEAFHVFQFRELKRPFADETSVRLYPCLSVDNNLGLVLEAEALFEALTAENESAMIAAAKRWLAVRLERRALLPQSAITYEDANEFTEGLAKYVELKLMDVLEGQKPGAALWLAQGFTGFNQKLAYREKLLKAMRANLRGEVNVNNDRFGTAPVRFRLYFSGMAIAALLDQLDVDWKTKIKDPNQTLTDLAAAALKLTSAEKTQLAAQARSHNEFPNWLQAKEKLAIEGNADTQRRLEQIVSGPNTLLILDFSECPDKRVGLGFTPFGVRGVDEHRTIYSMVPINGTLDLGKHSFAQTTPSPLLEDRQQYLFQMQLTEPINLADLQKRLGESQNNRWQPTDLKLELPGVTINAASAEVQFNEGKLRIKLLPVDN